MIETFLGDKPLQFIGLPLIAGFVCIWSWYMAIAMIEQARNLSGKRRAIWMVNSGLVTANGIWATHYIAMIAYASGGRAWYEIGDVLASAVLIYVCATVASYFLVYRASLAARLIAGFSLGIGVAAMPFIGSLSVAGGSPANWSPMVVFAAAASSVALAIGAVASLRRGRGGRSRVISLSLLVSAVALAHFFAWSGGPPSLAAPEAPGAVFGSLAYITKLIGFFGAVVFAGIAAGIVLDRYQEGREQYAAALEGMVVKLQASEREALAANAAKSAFLANINHEIRTPLNGVLGMLAVLQESKLDAEQKMQVKIARESADHLFQILKDILSLSVMDSGEIALECKPFDIRAVIGDVADLMAPKAAAKGLAFSSDIDPSAPAMLSGDAERIKQVLVNLVSNAIKFTDFGAVAVSATCGEIAGGVAPITIAVGDTGVGIDAAARATLFERFSQADNSLSRRFGGAGVGLAICQNIARLMEGEITVDSAPDKGSVFRFSFPCTVVEKKTAAENAAAQRSLKILVVDDNHSNLYFMSTLLGAEGHVCDFATDGFEAIRCATKEHYDIILMDVQMPELDGLAATRRIRAMERDGRRVPVLAVSAGDEEADPERCAAAGMDGYVAKPVRPAALRHAIIAAMTVAEPAPTAPIGRCALDPHPQPAQSASVPAPALDPDVLSSLFDLFGADGFQTAIGRTLDEATDLVMKIRFALTSKDFASAKKAAHGLKGMAASWGARRLADAAQKFEQEADAAGDPLALADELDRMIAAARSDLDSASWMKGPTRQRAIA